MPNHGGRDDTAVDDTMPVVHDEREHPPDERTPKEGIALCLSGGGYRAMLFHLGAIIRLNELGELHGLARISSVSGGSITAATLGRAWKDLKWDPASRATNLEALVVQPVIEMAGRTIDERSIIGGLLRPGRTVGENVARAYDKHLYEKATLKHLPDDEHGEGPRFVINATNVQTGKLFRFSRPYQGDWSVGLWHHPPTSLADAVAASSAFPPVLSPHTMSPSGDFEQTDGATNVGADFTTRLWLSDGGVYDNLGLETAWKAYKTILVSDGGGVLGPEVEPKRDWARHGIRVANIADGQVRALRRSQVVQSYKAGERAGTYWAIRSDVDDYELPDPFEFDDANRDRARGVKTRLKKLDDRTKRDLVNWGYVISDTALRKWVWTDAPRPSAVPL